MFLQVVICLTLVVGVPGQELTQPGPPNFCFKNAFHVNDQYHKDAPSSEGSDLPECQSWKESLCCTLALMETLGNRSKVEGLYNFSHELCAPISPGCAEYLRVCTSACICIMQTGMGVLTMQLLVILVVLKIVTNHIQKAVSLEKPISL